MSRAFLDLWADYDALNNARSLLGWDQQVLMPDGGASARSEHSTRLAGLAHSILTSDEMSRAVDNLEANAAPGSREAAMVRVVRRTLRIQNGLGRDLVLRKARASADAYETWKSAKPNNDYASMRPHYQEMFAIARETSARLAPGAAEPYDALIDLFEEGATTADTQRLFDAMKAPTIAMLDTVRNAPELRDDAIAHDFDRPTLLGFMRETVAKVGFDMDQGRLDLCRNAFCTNVGPTDVRMTTRPSNHLKGIVSSSLHEMGHALYEQNQDPSMVGTPLEGGVSLGLHESQSRSWENIVGRSYGFWRCFLPSLQSAFPELLGIDAWDMCRMMNRVEPTFVRVGADEVTYNPHIWIRFEIECALVNERLDFADLPDAWNSKYESYLGIRPATDTDGCLQDVHWSRGSVGYFPTYTLGNLMSYQIWEKLEADLPDWDERFAEGSFGEVLEWLAARIYRQGQLHAPRELFESVVGAPLSADAWIKAMTAKVGRIYA